MPTQQEATHALDCGQSMRVRKVYIEYCTHLAINWRCIVGTNQEIDY